MHPFILFLDFDGVLHPRTSGTCRYAPLLAQWLRSHPTVQVVISSTWRLQYPLAELQEWFDADVRHRIIAVTPELPGGAGSRQKEIEAWLRLNPTRRWAALDDETSLFQAQYPHLVLTQTAIGLTSTALEELSRRVEGGY